MNDWARVAERLGGISRAYVFKLWKSGQLESVTIGVRRFSTDRQIDDYIARLEQAATTAGGDAA